MVPPGSPTKFVGGPTYLVHHGGEKGRTGAIREGVRSRTVPDRNRLERLCDRASDGHIAKDGVGLALLQVTNSSKGSERNISHTDCRAGKAPAPNMACLT
jgi:hypothetical protein